jgi:hypothetical protein
MHTAQFRAQRVGKQDSKAQQQAHKAHHSVYAWQQPTSTVDPSRSPVSGLCGGGGGGGAGPSAGKISGDNKHLQQSYNQTQLRGGRYSSTSVTRQNAAAECTLKVLNCATTATFCLGNCGITRRAHLQVTHTTKEP